MLPFRIGNRRGPLKSGRRTAAEGTEIFFHFNNERTGEFMTGKSKKVAQSFLGAFHKENRTLIAKRKHKGRRENSLRPMERDTDLPASFVPGDWA